MNDRKIFGVDNLQQFDRSAVLQPGIDNDPDRYRRLDNLASFDQAIQAHAKIDAWVDRRRAHNRLVFGLLALGLILRFPLLFDSLWYDEVFTLWLARLPLHRLITALAGDVHPPFWYLIISIFIAWPGSARMLALAFGLGSLWLIRSFFVRLAPARPALIGWVLMITSPFLIYYSTEGRMYSMLLFFVALGARAALAGNWWLLGMSAGLGLLTHNHMAIYLPGLLIVFLLEVSFSLGEVSKMGLVAGSIYAPWAAIAWSQLQAVNGQYWILPLSAGRIVYLLVQVIAGYSLTGLGLLIVAGLTLALLITGIIRALVAGSYEIVILAVMPVLTGIVLSVVITPVLIPRVLIGAVPFLLVLIAWGGYELYQFAGHWVTVAGIAGGVIALYSMFASPARPDYASAYASLGVRNGDHCYHLSAGSHILASYYLPQCHHTTWTGAPRKANGLSAVTIEAMAIERGDFNGQGWIFATWEPFTPQAERDYLDQILSPNAQKFILLENDFVVSSAWRIAE